MREWSKTETVVRIAVLWMCLIGVHFIGFESMVVILLTLILMESWR